MIARWGRPSCERLCPPSCQMTVATAPTSENCAARRSPRGQCRERATPPRDHARTEGRLVRSPPPTPGRSNAQSLTRHHATMTALRRVQGGALVGGRGSSRGWGADSPLPPRTGEPRRAPAHPNVGGPERPRRPAGRVRAGQKCRRAEVLPNRSAKSKCQIEVPNRSAEVPNRSARHFFAGTWGRSARHFFNRHFFTAGPWARAAAPTRRPSRPSPG